MRDRSATGSLQHEGSIYMTVGSRPLAIFGQRRPTCRPSGRITLRREVMCRTS